MKLSTFVVSIALAMSLLLAGPGMAMAQSGKDTNQAIKTVIMDRLQKHKLLKGNDITVSVHDTVVTIDGTVGTLHQKRQVEHEAKEVAGTYGVVDNIAVKPIKKSDQDLYAAVVKQLQNNVFYSIFDWVNLDVSNGKVTLTGWVYEPWHKPQFQHQVERVVGVTSVENKIKVESGSPYDDDIRYKAARLIYDDPFYEAYSSVPGAPIHIIVNNGDVTLEGTVSTSFQKNWAQNAIYSNTGAFNVYNELRIE